MKFNVLEEIFKERGTSAEKLGPKVGLSSPGLRKAIKEGNFKMEVFLKLCKEIRIHPMYFLLPGKNDWRDFENLTLTDPLPAHREIINKLTADVSKLKDKIINLNDKMVEQNDRFLSLLESKK